MNQIGHVDRYKGQAITCFIDILGFSNFIKSEWGKNNTDHINKILNLKSEFILDNQSPTLIFKAHNLDEIEYYYDFKTVSDSFIITMPINNQMTNGEVFYAIMAFSIAIENIWLACIDNGFTLRGGIDYGSVFFDKDEIIGPAFIDAYNLESKISDVSRIVCSRTFTNLIVDISNKIGPICESLLEHYIIDYDRMLSINLRAGLLFDENSIKKVTLKLEKMRAKYSEPYIYRKYDTAICNLLNLSNVATLEKLKEVQQQVYK